MTPQGAQQVRDALAPYPVAFDPEPGPGQDVRSFDMRTSLPPAQVYALLEEAGVLYDSEVDEPADGRPALMSMSAGRPPGTNTTEIFFLDQNAS